MSETLDQMAVLAATDKSSIEHDYTRHYEKAFAQFRDEPIELLEIGIAMGSSLRMWERFFTRATIIGVDIIPECVQSAGGRKMVEIGSQSDVRFLAMLAEKYSPTIIIDDGSHQDSDIRLTIEHLFPTLRSGGCYVVEDLHFHHSEKDWTAPHGALKMVLDLAFKITMARKNPHDQSALEDISHSLDHIDFIPRAALLWKSVPDPDPAKTASELMRLVEQSGSSYNWSHFIQYLRSRGHLGMAEIAARKAITLGEALDRSFWRLSEVLESRGDIAGALAAAGQSLAHDPNNAHVQAWAARLLHRMGAG